MTPSPAAAPYPGRTLALLLLLLWSALLAGWLGTAQAQAVAAAAADTPGTTLQQWALAFVAAGNLLLGVSTWHTARQKAASARLDQFEGQVRDSLSLHADRISRLIEADKHRVTHDDLSEVYSDIKGIAAQVNALSGGVAQMNASINLLLNRTLAQ